MKKKNKNKSASGGKNIKGSDKDVSGLETVVISPDGNEDDGSARVLFEELAASVEATDQEDINDYLEEESKEDKTMPKKKPKITQKARQPRKGLGEELIEVYETAGDEFTSVTTLEHRRRTWQRMLVWILAFLVAVFLGVAGISWYIWGGTQQFTGENVSFTIDAPEEASSGTRVSYSINYENNEGTSFRKGELEMRYPPGFIFESAEPKPTSNDNLWDLGTISAGYKGTISLEGFLVGHPDVDTTISGVFRYWPANFSSEFNEVASSQTKMSAVDVELRLDGPEQVLVGQATNYSIVVNNDSENDIKDLMLEVVFPAEFVVDASLPEPEESENIWKITELAAGEEKEIQIDGYFSSAPEEEVEFIANLSLKGAEEEYIQQKEERFASGIIEGDLIVNLIANGSTKDMTIQWGEVINVSLNYQNNSEAILADLQAVVMFESRYRTNNADDSDEDALDWDELIDASNGSIKKLDPVDDNTLSHKSIIWNGKDVDSLDVLESDSEGTINIQIPLKDLAQAKNNIEHPEDVEIILLVEMIVGKTGDVEEEVSVTSNVIKFLIDSDLEFDAHARYYDDEGEALGTGPLPPEVGEKTTYQVLWDLTNTLHEVQDIIISAELPSNVAWTNEYDVSAGEIDFRASDNTITWRLNKMPVDIKDANVQFKISLNPSDRQIDEVATLTKKITMTATDSVTGGKIIQTFNPLNTGVDRDDYASDKGLVVE